MQVDSDFAAGRYAEAKRASDNAENINQVGIGIGILIIIANVTVLVAFIVASQGLKLH